MNRQERDVLNALLIEPYVNQRILSEFCGHSLGIVNRSIRSLITEGYLNEQVSPTEKAISEAKNCAPKNAIILAAGFGMRMAPINTEVPKALLEVNGELLIERVIRQLHQVGIHEIYVVVGFMKEQFEYLMDDFGVKLVVNSEYAGKNNLHSMSRVLDHLSNSYVIPCDIWCDENPFHRYELYSWYMVSDSTDGESTVRVNRKMELVSIPEGTGGNSMVGISYLMGEQASVVRKKIAQLSQDPRHDGSFWEEALYEGNRMIVQAKVVPAEQVVEINTYEQLRELDSGSNNLKSDALEVIGRVLKAPQNEIVNITVLKKGMTNRSFLFTCRGKKYIMRIPGEGTDQLINRKEEADVYRTIDGRQICDEIAYINPENGYKISAFLENARVCDPFNSDDVKKCMQKLRQFHEMGLTVDHEFDIFGQIDFYESLWDGAPSAYKDYKATKEKVFSLKPYIEKYVEKRTLTHIDAVPDNFLFIGDEIRLIDWEYAGMQDPHVDIAMFCIYSLYNKEQVDALITTYFGGECAPEIRTKIYCYISACGLLWSNWCEYKRSLGVEFGAYSLCQYRYAKEYYKAVQEEWKKIKENEDVHR
jgi:CTP:phosphocholine cytidylyltransferase-like protein/thiamine kinase-like enzyme